MWCGTAAVLRLLFQQQRQEQQQQQKKLLQLQLLLLRWICLAGRHCSNNRTSKRGSSCNNCGSSCYSKIPSCTPCIRCSLGLIGSQNVEEPTLVDSLMRSFGGFINTSSKRSSRRWPVKPKPYTISASWCSYYDCFSWCFCRDT